MPLDKLQKQDKFRALHTVQGFTFEWTFWSLELGCVIGPMSYCDSLIEIERSDSERTTRVSQSWRSVVG
ncbi:hypothetical protein TNCV_3960651 [Trichonephila clavipes]|nr:hypothetical protein TNCV_3960651 [Trichonephila clavipes]